MKGTILRDIFLSGPAGLREKRWRARPRTQKESMSLLKRLNVWWTDWTDMGRVLAAVEWHPMATVGEISNALSCCYEGMAVERVRLLLDRLVVAGQVMKGWNVGGEIRYWKKGFRLDDWNEEKRG
ncbi:MAG: hypothetical protein HQL66_03145 [Magnetococcales bacterium]|nr:hypothetical protein [Magnetococcales bacterium]